MGLSIKGRIVEISDTQWRGIKRLVVAHGDGESLLELPLDKIAAHVTLNVGDSVEVAVSPERDENYRDNWDIYMWGIVYSYKDRHMYVSVGGLIMSIQVVDEGGPFSIGSKVYIGVRKR